MTITRTNEAGSLILDIAFTDENGDTHVLSTLTSVRWQLTDERGNVINNNDFASNLITESPIVLTGDDLEIGSGGTIRFLGVKIVYNSSSGTGLTATEEHQFQIVDLKSIS